MTKYKVKVINVFSEIIEVEAENEDGARSAAQTILVDKDRQATHVYENTLPVENWAVITSEQYDKMVADFQKKAEAQGADGADGADGTDGTDGEPSIIHSLP